jgi:hypothetical protein
MSKLAQRSCFWGHTRRCVIWPRGVCHKKHFVVASHGDFVFYQCVSCCSGILVERANRDTVPRLTVPRGVCHKAQGGVSQKALCGSKLWWFHLSSTRLSLLLHIWRMCKSRQSCLSNCSQRVCHKSDFFGRNALWFCVLLVSLICFTNVYCKCIPWGLCRLCIGDMFICVYIYIHIEK